MKNIRHIILGPLLIVAAVMFAGCAGAPATVTEEKFLLDTLVTVKVNDVEKTGGGRVGRDIEVAFARAGAVEGRLDIHRAESETALFNRGKGARMKPVSADLGAALATGRTVYRQTSGAFDPTIGPLTRLWSFGPKERIPRAGQLRTALEFVDGSALSLDAAAPRAAGFDKPGMRLDLGGVAKGLAVDRMAETLRARGRQSALINAVSSIRALGPKANGEPWRIGVQSPRPKTTPGMIAVIELGRGAISTSGDYQRTFTKNGRRYHHVIDPKTGRPAPGFMSVTVVTEKTAAYADALSTGLAVMGRPRAMKLVETLPGVEALFVDEKGRFWTSPGLPGMLAQPLAKHLDRPVKRII